MLSTSTWNTIKRVKVVATCEWIYPYLWRASEPLLSNSFIYLHFPVYHLIYNFSSPDFNKFRSPAPRLIYIDRFSTRLPDKIVHREPVCNRTATVYRTPCREQATRAILVVSSLWKMAEDHTLSHSTIILFGGIPQSQFSIFLDQMKIILQSKMLLPLFSL